MTVTVLPGARTGELRAPASKSLAHRLLTLAALGERPLTLVCDGISGDVAATIHCLQALGAGIEETAGRLAVRPIPRADGRVPAGLRRLPCGESGSTLRFLLPVAGALGAECEFVLEGRLPDRPLAPLDRLLEAHGMTLRRRGGSLFVSGQLRPGTFSLPGNLSSQYFSGLLMALPLLSEDSRLTVTGELESEGYVALTEQTLALAGCPPLREGTGWRIGGGGRYTLPQQLTVEGDWSSAAFPLCMGALSEAGVTVRGLPADSAQGDRALLSVLERMGAVVEQRGDAVTVRRGRLKGTVIDAAQIPDLIPALAVTAAACRGITRVEHAARLRLKESDRLATTAALLTSLGGEVEERAEGLVIHGRGGLVGGEVESFGDHRIAMAAAVAAGCCREAVTVKGAQCVAKSYPAFWQMLGSLACPVPQSPTERSDRP
ncbi:MAG: 3-phosphoshikimate 1-carboxyvinyltransferase [Clostridia bacterium]|nr:3-phosphoshikimate 1-carboxyvinyltransferase [Clostridia bacterium]